MIELLLFLIFMTLVLYFTTRLVNALVNAIFRVVVWLVMSPWYFGIALWRVVIMSIKFRQWCETRYVEAERRARGV